MSQNKREKTESETCLTEGKVVSKNHPRILFRGKLDTLQATILEVIIQTKEKSSRRELTDELERVLSFVQLIQRSEALEEPFESKTALGLSYSEIREQSHNPQKYFGVEAMKPPHPLMGEAYIYLNRLRCVVRECELSAVATFTSGETAACESLVTALNRLSSYIHILMCRELSPHSLSSPKAAKQETTIGK